MATANPPPLTDAEKVELRVRELVDIDYSFDWRSEGRGWAKPHLEIPPVGTGVYFVGYDIEGRIQAFVATTRRYGSVAEILADARWPQMKQEIEDRIRGYVTAEMRRKRVS